MVTDFQNKKNEILNTIIVAKKELETLSSDIRKESSENAKTIQALKKEQKGLKGLLKKNSFSIRSIDSFTGK